MAQCYAEATKPFDGYSPGSLYCSYARESFTKYSVPPGSDIIVPMVLKGFHPKQLISKVFRGGGCHQKTEQACLGSTIPLGQTVPVPVPGEERDRSIVLSGENSKPLVPGENSKPPVPGKSSGEFMPKKVETSKAGSVSGSESMAPHRSDSDGIDKRNAGKSPPKSGSSSVRNSGEIAEVVDGSASQTGRSSTGSSSGCSSSNGNPSSSTSNKASTSASSPVPSHVSWPNTPANFRPSPKTRNLSEGNFSMYFPEGHSKVYGTSPPRRSRPSKDGSKDDKVGGGKTGSEGGSKFSKLFGLGHAKKGEAIKEGSAGVKKPRSCGSPTSTSGGERVYIRHSRNVSEGNWGAVNGARGVYVSRPASKVPVTYAEKIPAIARSKASEISGLVTGGSFTRTTTVAPAEKEKTSTEKHFEAPSYGNITKVGVAAANETWKKEGNVYYMAETMLLKKAHASKDPEEVKYVANEQYKKGNFAEALALYDRAISLLPGQATYHTNKAAALTGLGRLAEAVQGCLEALTLDSTFTRAHERLGALYLRLGWTEDARKHFLLMVPVDIGEIRRTDRINLHFLKCQEAKKLKDWQMVIKASDAAIAAGADHSIQAYSFKAQAQLKLKNVHEAEKMISYARRLSAMFSKHKNVVDERMLLIVQAEIDLVQGRFDEALRSAERAKRNEPFNAQAIELETKLRRIASARARGNELFKAEKYYEAIASYGEGLELDPENAVLLCNRAACRWKLRLWESAITDCNAVLSKMPNYTKALMRRAECLRQLERWEDALMDYEVLKSQLPNDMDIATALSEAQVALKKSKGEHVYSSGFRGGVQEVYTPEHFQKLIAAQGLAVVHFITRWSARCKEITPFIDLLCKRYPSVHFLKVDIEDHPSLAKTECVGTVPTFKMYKNGCKVMEMLGPSQQKLEDAVLHYVL